jgi:hypothetical protein
MTGLRGAGFGLTTAISDNLDCFDSLDFDGGGHRHYRWRFDDRRRRLSVEVVQREVVQERAARFARVRVQGQASARERRRGFSRARSCNPALDGGQTIGRSVQISAQALGVDDDVLSSDGIPIEATATASAAAG